MACASQSSPVAVCAEAKVEEWNIGDYRQDGDGSGEWHTDN